MSYLKEIFCNNTPLLDLRAPIEFSKGAFPNAKNIPLLTDDEREQVGTCYKQQGQDKAIVLGHTLVSGEVKSQRLKAWESYFKVNPEACLYCFRGGMRSHLVQEWLKEQGMEIPLIKGGYKALRNYLIGVLQQPLKLIRLSGQTGVGKTDLLLQFQHMIDLEGLANHRGSAFGQYISAQPSQIDFENHLAIEILKKQQENQQPIIVEDESRFIGSINLPQAFAQNMQRSAVVILTCTQKERIQRIYRDYVANQKSDFIQHYSERGPDLFNQSLLTALQKIQKRLGGVRYKKLEQIMRKALKNDCEELHKQWISELLENYYDPMYNYQLDKKSVDVVFRGDKDEIKQYLEKV